MFKNQSILSYKINTPIRVNIVDSKISDYNSMLSKFKGWVQFSREIKISSLLDDGNRIKFDIEDILSFTNGINGYISASDYGGYRNICFTVRSMSFIIKGDKVDELYITIKTIDNQVGNALKSLIESGIVDIDIRQLVSSNDQILCFYIGEPDELAA